MKKLILLPAFAAILLSLSLASCQKNDSKEKEPETDYQTQATVQSDDQGRVSTEVDAVSNDADILLESSAGFTARSYDIQGAICDATVTADTSGNVRTLTIVYNGSNCLGSRTRTGTVIISMPAGTRWKNAGAAVTITFQNLKVTRIADNKSITINGSKTYTNTSGGLLINLPTVQTITHTVTSSNLMLTFDDGTVRKWQIAHQRVYTYDNGVVITMNGLHTEGNITNIAEWGTTRFNQSFTTAVIKPVVVKQSCNLRITSGELKHTTPFYTSSVVFGLNATGVPTGCPGAGVYFLKLTFTGPAGNTQTGIFPY